MIWKIKHPTQKGFSISNENANADNSKAINPTSPMGGERDESVNVAMQKKSDSKKKFKMAFLGHT